MHDVQAVKEECAIKTAAQVALFTEAQSQARGREKQLQEEKERADEACLHGESTTKDHFVADVYNAGQARS